MASTQQALLNVYILKVSVLDYHKMLNSKYSFKYTHYVMVFYVNTTITAFKTNAIIKVLKPWLLIILTNYSYSATTTIPAIWSLLQPSTSVLSEYIILDTGVMHWCLWNSYTQFCLLTKLNNALYKLLQFFSRIIRVLLLPLMILWLNHI